MPETARGITYRVDDLTPPWRTGATPLLLHHGIGTDLGIWSEWVPLLAADRAVIRLDMRGFGASDVPPQDHDFTIDELVADVWDVVAATGAERVHLAGESMGGSIVLAAALAQPDRTASVALSNATYTGRGLGEVANWRAQFVDGAAAWSTRMMANRFAPGVGDPAALAWFDTTQARTLPHVAIGLGAALSRLDLTDDLSRLAAPLSVVLPAESPFVPVAHGEALAGLVPSATLRVVPGVRHGLPFSHAVSEAAALGRWLREIEPARA